MVTRGPLLFALAGTALVIVEGLTPVGLVRDLLFLTIGAYAVAGTVVGIRRNRPRRPRPWYLLAAGLASWVLGDALWVFSDHVLGIDPFPSVADVAYLSAYPLLAAGLHMLLPVRDRRTTVRALLDTAIVGVCVALVLWVAFIEPTWTEPVGTFAQQATAVAYPIGDAVLLGYLVHLGVSSVVRDRSLRLIAASLVLVLVADVAFQSLAYVDQYEGSVFVLDPLFALSYLALAAAALDPSMRAVGDVRPARIEAGGRIAFLTCAALFLPVTLLVEDLLAQTPHVTEAAAAAAVVIGLIAARMVLMLRHIQRQAAHLSALADTDFLTGLLNRRRLVHVLSRRTADARRGAQGRSAVLLLGLDRFTEVNDTLGHRIGDELLRAVAARLRSAAPEGAVLARLGGDVFGVLVPGVADDDDAARHARLLAGLLGDPVVVSDLGVDVEGGVGFVVLPDDGADPAELLHRADVALSAARGVADRVARYDPRMELGGALAPELMAELGAAMAAGQVVVHYQPQVDVCSGRVVGAEALVRWQHPVHGLLGPNAFIPAAERTGQIRPLTRLVLDHALAECARWQADRPLSVSVNLSVRNLLDPAIVDDVRDALERHRLDPSLVELEITETSAMVDQARSATALRALAALGVTLSIDDYGTGYGSLAYLQELPVQRLKIDRSFVSDLRRSHASAAIVRSVVDLSQRLGLSVVAEGVEDDETLVLLRDMRCDLAQGFGLGRPVPADRLCDVVRRIDAHVPAVLGLGVPAQRAH
ncbi:putative bifunctional diguanylate cyclase/phosphodiesterase [Cellulomonas carbonis]|uniref:Diguanylate cyclase n=1 Tax=Cellulomonas carbonis T26 TaxID=947969 RepID=A0A0A0BVP6_9CELL|nr:bifunctional diguanylate cyclase/phosphodiesterase [Cellulomonas carbonis]KGM11214.1 diguanylate cyclase [Cellulomonas carbonis T26]GGC10777.1 hypothetical protein GCM10010972_25120 [Cellulomonas carbonis]